MQNFICCLKKSQHLFSFCSIKKTGYPFESLLRQSKQQCSLVKVISIRLLLPSRLIMKNDNVISAPFISHGRDMLSRRRLPALTFHAAPILCLNLMLRLSWMNPMAQLDRRRNYNGTLCLYRSPFELLKCLQRKRPKYVQYINSFVARLHPAQDKAQQAAL